MEAELTCRRARAEDVSAILEVAHSSWWATYEGIMADEEIGRRLSQSYSRDHVEQCVADPEALFLVAEHGSNVVGYAHLGWARNGPELFRLYLRPDFWRRGVGTSLIGELESELRAMGVREYRCRVHPGNAIGRAFYTKVGFDRDESWDDEEGWGLVRRLHSRPIR